jgi:hypothetical protein
MVFGLFRVQIVGGVAAGQAHSKAPALFGRAASADLLNNAGDTAAASPKAETFTRVIKNKISQR